MSNELERETVSRHDFLSTAGVGSAVAAIAFSTIGMLRLPKPRVLPDVSRVIRLGKPSEFPPGTVAMLPKQRICVIASEAGVAAVSLVCTHLGCILKRTEAGFDCPCHGSKFDPRGKVLAGPAPRGLPWFVVSQAPDGTLLADLTREVAPEASYKAST